MVRTKKYMNKTRLIPFLGLAALLAACKSDEPAPSTTEAPFSILEAKTYLPVEAGSSTVRLDQAPATVYSRDSWLKVAVQGSTITLSSTSNDQLESRNTQLVVKDSKGDSIALNIMQEGIIFGLPKEQAMVGGDEAIDKTIKVASNVQVTYTASADWIKVSTSGKQLHIEAAANTTKTPRTGWIIAKGAGHIDSLEVTQASLADIAGTYTQRALTLNESGAMVPFTSTLVIKEVTKTQASVIVDGTYTWEASFTPGRALELLNGKVVKTVTTGAKPVYIVTVLAADDFTNEHKNMILGTREPVLISITREGKLVFAEKFKIASEQTWASYGFVRSSSNRLTQGTYLGIEQMYIQPKLSKKS